MKFIDFLEPESIKLSYPFVSKKRLFESVSQLMASQEKQQLAIYQSFVEREKLGNTSLGNGVAIPHGKSLPVTEDILIQILRLSSPADYEGIDSEPVSLVVAMAFPLNTKPIHKQIMNEAVMLFKQHRLYKAIMTADTPQEIIDQILETQQTCNSWSS